MNAWLLPIGLALGGQTVAALLWGADLNARVKSLEAQMAPLKALAQKVSDNLIELKGEITALNTSISWLRHAGDQHRQSVLDRADT